MACRAAIVTKCRGTHAVSYHAKQLLQHILKKNPRERATIAQIRVQPWLDDFDLGLLPLKEENTSLSVEVTAEEVKHSLTEIVSLQDLVRLARLHAAADGPQNALRRMSTLSQTRGRLESETNRVASAHQQELASIKLESQPNTRTVILHLSPNQPPSLSSPTPRPPSASSSRHTPLSPLRTGSSERFPLLPAAAPAPAPATVALELELDLEDDAEAHVPFSKQPSVASSVQSRESSAPESPMRPLASQNARIALDKLKSAAATTF